MDLTKKRAASKRWREKNAEWNREYQREYARKWREEHRDGLRTERGGRFAYVRKGRRQGEKHPLWKGDGAGYFSMHTWVVRHKGTPSKCEHCKSTTAKKYEWCNVDHQYERNLDDYVRLCTKCHRKYDYANGLAKKGGRKPKPP